MTLSNYPPGVSSLTRCIDCIWSIPYDDNYCRCNNTMNTIYYNHLVNPNGYTIGFPCKQFKNKVDDQNVI